MLRSHLLLNLDETWKPCLIMDHLHPKTRSSGHILENPCFRAKAHIYDSNVDETL